MADCEMPAAALQDTAQCGFRVARPAGGPGIKKQSQAVDVVMNQEVEDFLDRPCLLSQRSRYREGMASQAGKFCFADTSCVRLQKVEQRKTLLAGCG